MKKSGIRSIYHACRNRYGKGKAIFIPPASNVLAHSGEATRVGEHWAGDMTYLKTKEGPLFMAAVIDLFTRKVIGWGFSKIRDTSLVDGALKMSLSRENRSSGCLFHSDQGSEYRSTLYLETLDKAGMVASMSRPGTPTDNAFVESFFGTLKNELVHHYKFKSMIECVARIIEYVEFYNRTRLHSSLGYLSPETYEAMNT